MKVISKKYISIFILIFMVGNLINYIPVNAETLPNSSTVKEKSKDDKKEKESSNKEEKPEEKEISVQKEPKVTIDTSVKLIENTENQKIRGKGKPGDTVLFLDEENKAIGQTTVQENRTFEGQLNGTFLAGKTINVIEENDFGKKSKSDPNSIIVRKKEADKKELNTPLNKTDKSPIKLKEKFFNIPWSDSVNVNNETAMNITRSPKYASVKSNNEKIVVNLNTTYIIYDPSTKEFQTDTNNNLNGWWKGKSLTEDKSGFAISLDKESSEPLGDDLYYLCYNQKVFFRGQKDLLDAFPEMFTSKSDQNNFSLSLEQLNTIYTGGWGNPISSWDIDISKKHDFSIYYFSNGVKKPSSSFDWSNSIPFYIKAPKVEVKTDDESLQTMLKNQTITGTGQAGDTVTISNWGVKFTGTVDSNGKFSIPVSNLHYNDNPTLWETNGTGDKSASDPVNVEFKATKNEISINSPKYIIMDPVNKVFLDDHNNSAFLQGNWSSSDLSDNNEFGFAVSKESKLPDPLYKSTWLTQMSASQFDNKNYPSFSELYKNNNIINSYNLDLSYLISLSDGKENLYNLSVNNKYYCGLFINPPTVYTWPTSPTIPFYIKAPKVSVKTDDESLLTMLKEQKITGTGQAGDTVTIKDGDKTWTGTVNSDGSFSIATAGVKLGDTVTITQINGTGDKSISDPVSITIKASKDSLNITKQPKYIIMDPNNGTPTFVDDQGNNPEISGNWSSSSTGNLQEFVTEIGKKENPSSNWQWYAGIDDESILKNNNLSNNFSNISLLSALNKTKGESNSYKLTELAISQEYVLFEGIKNSDGTWTYSSNQAIPFYIKAPKVSVKTDDESLQTMLKEQKITGTGQAGDKVTIKDGDKTWTGTVNSDGSFSIATAGVKLGDTVTITQINGTGDKSISDPVSITINASKDSLNLTKQPKYIIMDANGSSPTFTDENGKDAIFNGTWSSTKIGENLFTIQIGDRENPISDYNWYGGESAGISLLNKLIFNEFNYNASNGLKVGIDTLKGLSTNKQYSFLLGRRKYGGDGWISTVKIPFYIKAPKVSVKTDDESLLTMINEHKITGTGQAGDTVTIKDGDKTWTGTVNSDGSFSITTAGLKLEDTVTITQINGTGDKSISDPITIKFNNISFVDGKTPEGTKINPSIIGKSVGILFTPESFSFGSLNELSLGGVIHQTITKNQYVAIGDIRENNNGWKLTAQMSNFKNDKNINLLGKITMNTSIKHITFKDGSYVIDKDIPKDESKQAPELNNKEGNVELNIGKDAVTIMNAQKGTGKGLWATDMSNITLEATDTNNIIQGSYKGEVNWNLSVTP